MVVPRIGLPHPPLGTHAPHRGIPFFPLPLPPSRANPVPSARHLHPRAAAVPRPPLHRRRPAPRGIHPMCTLASLPPSRGIEVVTSTLHYPPPPNPRH